jgi:hypothetical protein
MTELEMLRLANEGHVRMIADLSEERDTLKRERDETRKDRDELLWKIPNY